MRRREFIGLVGGAAVAWPVTAVGQVNELIRRVGVLIALTEDNPEGQVRIRAFRQQLEQLGWIEGRNTRIDYRWPGGNGERLRASVAQLVSMRPDVVFAGNTTALEALRRSGSGLPIVFAQVADPLARGYVTSIARPGGNITGFANQEHAIAAKWLELIREVAPQTANVGIVYDPASEGQKYESEIAKGLPPTMTLLSKPVRNQSELEDSIKQIATQPNGALIVLSGPLTAIHRDLIISLGARHRLPLIHPYQYYTAAGGLISYGPDLIDQYRRAAGYVDRILRGENPGDLPVQFPTKYILAINLRTAKTLGLTVPPMLLARADEVIE